MASSKQHGHSSSQGTTLLEYAGSKPGSGLEAPLADRMRPRVLAELCGQTELLHENSFLRRAIENDRIPSMLLWGPPGCGKTTLAHVISQSTKRFFAPFHAVLGGLAELRQVIDAADERRRYQGQGTILFVDEIHRFNKAQQDAFLPHMERGTITLIGATTENPSFRVNSAVISRCRVFRLQEVDGEAILQVLYRALSDTERGLGKLNLEVNERDLRRLANAVGGDVRRALGALEIAAEHAADHDSVLSPEILKSALGEASLHYDQQGEEHYNLASAMIKSLRGSDPDAAIYWLMRMIDSGEDPLFLSRRLLIFASEDVGNADPRALQVAVSADQAFQRMGLPEGIYPLAQACLYLATCPKSNAVTTAWKSAREAIAAYGALPVPLHLRNAPTKIMSDEGYGKNYRYPHDFPQHFVVGEQYLPDRLHGEASFYNPSDQGLESKIAERLERLRRGE